jgi:hypothetical protein
MMPKMIGSRMVLKTLMGAVDVAALIGDSSARIARKVPGCDGTPPTSARANSSVQGRGPSLNAGRKCFTGPSASNSCAIAKRWNGTPNSAIRFNLTRCCRGTTVRPREFRTGSRSAGPMTQAAPLRSTASRDVSVHSNTSGGGRSGHLTSAWRLSPASSGCVPTSGDCNWERSSRPRIIYLPSRRRGGSKHKSR